VWRKWEQKQKRWRWGVLSRRRRMRRDTSGRSRRPGDASLVHDAIVGVVENRGEDVKDAGAERAGLAEDDA
jgi:hypothetical protein